MSKPLTKGVRLQVWGKYEGHCGYCGTPIKYQDMQVDHIFPKSGMTQNRKNKPANIDDISNLMPTCRSCNIFKSNSSLENFRKHLESQIHILRRDRPSFRLAERYGLIECKPKKIVFYFENKDNFVPILYNAIVTKDDGSEELLGIHHTTHKGYKLQEDFPEPIIPLQEIKYKHIIKWI